MDIVSTKTTDSTNEEEDTNREKPHKCNQCNYSSTQAACLRRHFKTHTGEKLNKCNQCNYASSEAGHLRSHLKTHIGEKSNKCNQCKYTCSHPTALRIHLKIHSGEKQKRCIIRDRPVDKTYNNTKWVTVKEL